MIQEIENDVSVEQPPALEQEQEREARIREPETSYTQRRFYNGLALAVSDGLALGVAFLVAGALRYWLVSPEFMVVSVWIGMLLPVWWAGAALRDLLPGWGYGPAEELRRLTQLLCVVYAGLAITLFFAAQTQAVSRLVLGLAFLFSLWTVPYARMLVRRGLLAVGWWGVPAAVYGAGRMGRRIVQLLRQEKGIGYHPVVMYDDDPAHWGGVVEGIQVLGSAKMVMPYASVAVLAMPEAGSDRVQQLLEGPLDHYRSTLVIPRSFKLPSLWVRPRDLGGLLGLEVKNNLSSLQSRVLKRTVDLLIVGVTFPLWGAVCVLLAVLVWWEDGANPFFLQKRIGKNGRCVTTIKFRTMVPNAEAVLQKKLEEDDELRRQWNASYKLKDDPRVTRIGSVLRRFSLDELPQLWNVLRGEMSLVGPRPLPAYHHEALTERARILRERVRPGLTGLWQIAGRSDAGTEGMDKYDPYYVRNWSLWLDAVILVRTLRTVMTGRGAY